MTQRRKPRRSQQNSRRQNSRIADLKGQLDVTSQKLGLTQDELCRARGLAQSIKKDQQTSDEQLASKSGAV